MSGTLKLLPFDTTIKSFLLGESSIWLDSFYFLEAKRFTIAESVFLTVLDEEF